jgi:hypothetical protein
LISVLTWTETFGGMGRSSQFKQQKKDWGQMKTLLRKKKKKFFLNIAACFENPFVFLPFNIQANFFTSRRQC